MNENQTVAGILEICHDLKSHVPEVVAEWERLVREEPWYSLPAAERIDNLPDVVVGLVEASLCRPLDEEAHRRKIEEAAQHGRARRTQGIPEHLMPTEYHLLRRALSRYLIQKFGSSDHVTKAILEFDTAISVATNASMWGYYREEIEAIGKWEAGMERILRSSLL